VTKSSDVKDLSLAARGRERIEWALQEMPVVRRLMDRFETDQPLRDVRISGCLHIRRLEEINLPELRRIGLRLQGVPRGAYLPYVTLGTTQKMES
jgi:adenosylhomocysteinase